ncbi:hypothetical protein [Oceanibacterium hippocampi]|uniref:Phage head-tail joining protein n=1 Tax=Oceanibacterium hippocampi TaxID=745714 RepID=A0A1Y5S5H2_9PROT|nr:hypothetical protein [Oceanibacterium hippocampi]SLN31773.1 hypothetical protein OCH7691_01153 [Oceanibacterium hippocampi]
MSVTIANPRRSRTAFIKDGAVVGDDWASMRELPEAEKRAHGASHFLAVRRVAADFEAGMICNFQGRDWRVVAVRPSPEGRHFSRLIVRRT